MTSMVSLEDALRGVVIEGGQRTLTRGDILAFCEISGDRSPPHVDDALMQRSPYGGVIAHGLLVMAIASGLADAARPIPVELSYGYERVRFLGGVRVGDTLSVRQKFMGARPYPKDGSKALIDMEYTVIANGERPVAVYTHVLLGPRLPAPQATPSDYPVPGDDAWRDGDGRGVKSLRA